MMPLKEITDFIKAGKKIQAVKLVMDSTGFSLKDAKDYVDELEVMLKKTPDKPEQRRYASGVSAIDGMDGHEFEYFCADLLRKVGFLEVSVTPGSGDQGVDVLAVKDGIKYAIQCKNYASALSNTPVQEVSAGKQFYGCHVGVVMTNSTFTPGAVQLATATNVLLWDRRKLDELISMAGGPENLGIFPEYDDFDSDDELDDEFDGDFDDDEDSVVVTKINRPRKGMAIWSKICLGWSVLCFLIFVGGLVADSQEAMIVGLGEGLFILVLGLMFGALAKTEKGNPYIYIGRKGIKKSVFVIMCIVIAYVFFIVVMGITGGFATTS